MPFISNALVLSEWIITPQNTTVCPLEHLKALSQWLLAITPQCL